MNRNARSGFTAITAGGIMGLWLGMAFGINAWWRIIAILLVVAGYTLCLVWIDGEA